MGVALLGWGRFFDQAGHRVTVIAPNTEPGAPWLLDFLSQKARRLREVGFTAIQLPPTCKAQGGAGRRATVSGSTIHAIWETNGQTHDVIFQETMGKSIYAFDAQTGAELWTVNLGRPVTGTQQIDA